VTVFHDALGAVLGQIARDSCGLTVTYHRGASSVEVTAVAGQTPQELVDSHGTVIRQEVRDFIIEAAAIDFGDGAGPVEPQPGDRIKERRDYTLHLYDVMPLGNAPCFEEVPPQGVNLRIHTKAVGTE